MIDAPKPKRRRNRPAPVIIVADGMGGGEVVQLSAPDEFAEALKASEQQVLESLGDLVDDQNENAATTACIRLLDVIQDKSTPGQLRDKLLKHRMSAFRRLVSIATDGLVAAARSNAASYCVKLQKTHAPAAWPPNVNAPEFQTRLTQAEAMCKLQAVA